MLRSKDPKGPLRWTKLDQPKKSTSKGGLKSHISYDKTTFGSREIMEFYKELKKRKIEFIYRPVYCLLDSIGSQKNAKNILVKEKGILQIKTKATFEVKSPDGNVHIIYLHRTLKKRKNGARILNELTHKLIKINLLSRYLMHHGQLNHSPFILMYKDIESYFARIDEFEKGNTEYISTKFVLS